MRLSWRTFFWVWLAWTSIGLIHAFSRYSDIIQYNLQAPFELIHILAYVMTYTQWIIITLTLLKILQSFVFPLIYWKVFSVFFVGMMLWLPLYFVSDYSVAALLFGGDVEQVIQRLKTTSASIVFFYVVLYGLTFVACLGVVFAENTRRANKLNAELLQRQTETALVLSEHKMQLMQSQLSPHFLFNCLGAISGLARSGDRQALIKAVASVGNLLRYTVDNSALSRIPVEEELKFVSDYIELQTLRFADRFNYNSKISNIDLSLECPPFTLQPLLENTFRHAVEATEESVKIDVTVTHQDNRITFDVKNTIPTKTCEAATSGTGLKNLRTRLVHLYPDDFELNITNDEQLFCVSINIPVGSRRHEL